jgi:hypothetical protein
MHVEMAFHLNLYRQHYHVHCPTPDRTLLVQNRQRAPVFHLRHIILLQLRVGSQDLICVSIAKWVSFNILKCEFNVLHHPRCPSLWICIVCYLLQSIFVLMDTLVVIILLELYPICLLADWPVSVSYRHLPVGIFGMVCTVFLYC